MPPSVLLAHGLQLTDDLPDDRSAVQRDVGVVSEIVEDDNRAGGADVHGFFGVKEPRFRIGRALPDVPRDGRVFCEHVKNVCYLFYFICCHGIASQKDSNSSWMSWTSCSRTSSNWTDLYSLMPPRSLWILTTKSLFSFTSSTLQRTSSIVVPPRILSLSATLIYNMTFGGLDGHSLFTVELC